ncbi:hypothetical protein HPB52_014401 [Rhipicephalus sanguineus]|uniref:PIPK domain-containing protein n=1 Tax=Rhipicephalus sanguineus TaxID=34632 RepID=A0A9D4PSU8_RHISA|nr:hypothetical protein HPB52_014401 [Rhipicephalus sanguineus]
MIRAFEQVQSNLALRLGEVLESFKIMDYSLLIGIHNIDQAAKEQVLYAQNSSGITLKPCTQERQSQGAKDEVKLDPPAGAEDDSISKPAGITPTSTSFSDTSFLLNVYRTGGIPAKNSKGERLLLFIGVIDILQSYRLLKKLEHTWKSMFHDKSDVGKPAAKKGCQWHLVTHDLLTQDELDKTLATVNKSATLKFEPFILHVRCHTLDAAQKLLAVSIGAGCRNSGIMLSKSGKVHVSMEFLT